MKIATADDAARVNTLLDLEPGSAVLASIASTTSVWELCVVGRKAMRIWVSGSLGMRVEDMALAEMSSSVDTLYSAPSRASDFIPDKYRKYRTP